jgi:prophage DNA circulation protein
MGNDATDVVEMDDDKINKLRQVFQDMVSVTSAVTEEPYVTASSSSSVSSGQSGQSGSQSQSAVSSKLDQSGSQPQSTSSSQSGKQKVLTITIMEKAYQEMTAEYGLSSDQVEVLNEMLSDDNREQLESIIKSALS